MIGLFVGKFLCMIGWHKAKIVKTRSEMPSEDKPHRGPVQVQYKECQRPGCPWKQAARGD